MAEYHYTDGTAYAPTQLLAKQKMEYGYQKTQLDLVIGTNGHYLKFENASDLGNDRFRK